jgi:hypothetical protein
VTDILDDLRRTLDRLPMGTTAYAINERAIAEITRLRAALAAEREECAKLAEGNIVGDFRTWPHQPGDYDNVCVQSTLADAIAAAIRARRTS